MIEIKHRDTGEVLHRVDADTLEDADLAGADLSGAQLFETNFTDCSDLHESVSLAQVVPNGPSTLDARTLRACIHDLPDVFLQGVGYTNKEIEHLRALYADKAPQYFSCFISYARVNADFAEGLHTDLQGKNVPCWKDDHDIRSGDFWWAQIGEAIKKHDKLIVVCSEQSLSHTEVVEEIVAAIEQERKAGIQKLFPITLDRFIYSSDIEEATLKRGSRVSTCRRVTAAKTG